MGQLRAAFFFGPELKASGLEWEQKPAPYLFETEVACKGLSVLLHSWAEVARGWRSCGAGAWGARRRWGWSCWGRPRCWSARAASVVARRVAAGLVLRLQLHR